jgi:hypothetical protein
VQAKQLRKRQLPLPEPNQRRTFVRSPISLCAVSAVVLLASLAGAETLTVPLNIEGARIFVTVRVNDKTARLLLDTGAGMTFVGPKFATAPSNCNASTLST